jgi:hypothetical protein
VNAYPVDFNCHHAVDTALVDTVGETVSRAHPRKKEKTLDKRSIKVDKFVRNGLIDG